MPTNLAPSSFFHQGTSKPCKQVALIKHAALSREIVGAEFLASPTGRDWRLRGSVVKNKAKNFASGAPAHNATSMAVVRTEERVMTWQVGSRFGK
jgi:hypothetical protein